MIQASVCTIGDEILIGQIVDTNSSEIAKRLNLAGIKVRLNISVSDSREEIRKGLLYAADNSDLVIVTGGLGPTKDDITKDVLREISGSDGYVMNGEQFRIMYDILSSRGIAVSELNRNQALVPEKAEVLPNRLGTAPGMMLMVQDSSGKRKPLYALPGVPFEATGLMPQVMESIGRIFNAESVYHRTIYTFGIPESTLAEKISEWEERLKDNGFSLAYLPSPLTGVRLRISRYGGSADVAASESEPFVRDLKEMLGTSVYGEHDSRNGTEDCTSLVTAVSGLLKEKGLTLSAAESCTGGMISQLMTSVPGCSEWYMGSVTSYSNGVKTKVLGVNPDTIEKHGAVSCTCVEEMAEGVRKLMGTDFSVATSGIAGPGGGTEEKPVGTVFVAVSSAARTVSAKFMFRGRRIQNIERFSAHALNMLREELMSIR